MVNVVSWVLGGGKRLRGRGASFTGWLGSHPARPESLPTSPSSSPPRSQPRLLGVSEFQLVRHTRKRGSPELGVSGIKMLKH